MMCGHNVCYEELPVCNQCLSLVQELLTEKCDKCNKVGNACECHDGDGHRFMFHYNGLVSKKLMYLIKTELDMEVADFFVELAVNTCGLNMDSYDGIAFVPRYKKNLRKYGYNQAEEIAKSFSRKYGLPIIDALERVGGREQKLLSRGERIKNIKGNYRIRKDYNVNEKYAKILLVDDIYTTGATMKICADLLRGTVARAVVPFTFAKTKIV